MGAAKKDAKVLIAEVFEVDVADIPKDVGIGNYDRWDSLGHLRIVVYIEEFLGRSLDTEEILSIIDLKSIQELIDSY